MPIDNYERYLNTLINESRQLRATMNQLNSTMDKTSQSFDKGEKSLDSYNETVEKGSSSINKFTVRLAATTAVMKALETGLKSPMSLLQTMNKGYEDVKNTVLEWENAIVLGAKQLQYTSASYNTAEKAVMAYKKAIDDISKSTKLSREEALKIFNTFQVGFKGIKTEETVNQITNVIKALANLGLTAEETQRNVQTVLELGNRFKEFELDKEVIIDFCNFAIKFFKDV